MSTKEKTLSIIKPDATERNIIGTIIQYFEKNQLRVSALKLTSLSKKDAELFYQEHKERPFFNDLVQFMISGPVVLMVLEGENAIGKNREIMGATDPKKADSGTIRADLALDIERNTVHGSDSKESAAREIAFFFSQTDIVEK